MAIPAFYLFALPVKVLIFNEDARRKAKPAFYLFAVYIEKNACFLFLIFAFIIPVLG
jgi:hypothetical protein